MGKRGIGHIEVLFAFIMFITFIGLAVYFFSPTVTQNSMDFESSYVLKQLDKNLISELVRISVLLEGNSDIKRIEIDESYSSYGAYVESSYGTKKDFLKSKYARYLT